MAEVNILLVEDDEVDVMAVKRALKELKIANPLFRAADGVEGLEILLEHYWRVIEFPEQ